MITDKVLMNANTVALMVFSRPLQSSYLVSLSVKEKSSYRVKHALFASILKVPCSEM